VRHHVVVAVVSLSACCSSVDANIVLQVSLQPRCDALNLAGKFVGRIDDVGVLGARGEAYKNCRLILNICVTLVQWESRFV
jgi:hypothetical protein